MRKSKMWRMLTVAAVAASMTCGVFGVQSVSAADKKTLKVAMECGYAPYNWTQPDDSNGAVQISGSSDYAYGYDVMMAKKIADELGYDLEIVIFTSLTYSLTILGIDTNLQFIFEGIIILAAVTLDCLKYVQKK